MGKPEKAKCNACKGMGWYFFDTGTRESPRYEVQRCDVCEQFEGDLAALQALEKAAQAQPALMEFVEKVAELKHEHEPDGDEPFEPVSEDCIATLNELILEARELLDTADKCDVCGNAVPYVFGCPGGAEVCQACFDAGWH